MNKVILVGRLTADPELRQTPSGVSSCRFTVAVDRRFADKNTGERQADFISCTAWRQTAEFVSRYFSKGRLIAVEGSLRNNNHQDRNRPDVTHYTMDVQVDTLSLWAARATAETQAAVIRITTATALRRIITITTIIRLLRSRQLLSSSPQIMTVCPTAI